MRVLSRSRRPCHRLTPTAAPLRHLRAGSTGLTGPGRPGVSLDAPWAVGGTRGWLPRVLPIVGDSTKAIWAGDVSASGYPAMVDAQRNWRIIRVSSLGYSSASCSSLVAAPASGRPTAPLPAGVHPAGVELRRWPTGSGAEDSIGATACRDATLPCQHHLGRRRVVRKPRPTGLRRPTRGPACSCQRRVKTDPSLPSEF
jgi:hypothetical protein